MCDFETRALGQNQKFSIQCVLPINLFNEKIFLFLYCWILLVVIITTTNLFLWIYRIAFAFSRQKYIMKHLTLMGRLDEKNRRYSLRVTKRLIGIFIHDYLRPDGVFLPRLIAIITNCLIASEIIANLWDEFFDDEKNKRKASIYNEKYRKKYGSDNENSLAESGFGNEDNYSSGTQDKIVIKKRSQKSFSIFQPNSLDDSQMTSSMVPKEIADLRRFRREYKEKGNGMPPRVGFQEPGAGNYSSDQPVKKPKKNPFYVCIDCDDDENDSQYDANLAMIDPAVKKLKAKKDPRKPAGFGKKLKDLFIYDSSASDTDFSDPQPDFPARKRKPKKPKQNKSFLSTCLSMEEPNSDEDKGPGSIRSVGTSNQEHRQDTIPTNPRMMGNFGPSGVQPPAYTQAAGMPTATVLPRSYVPSATGVRSNNV